MANPQSDWQVKCRSINERGAHVLANGMYADCKFVVGSDEDKEVISSHKNILAMSSPVFEAMLFGALQEKSDEPIAIPDVRPSVFQSLLKYIYTDSFDINSIDEAGDIYYVGKKYIFPCVIEKCRLFLLSRLSPKTACHIYEIANLFDDVGLSEESLEVIRVKTMGVLNDSSFKEIHFSTLLLILNQDELTIDSELNLFHAVERFANNLNVRENVGERPDLRRAIELIRFLVLDPTQFASIACTVFFKQDEAFIILMNILSPGKLPMPVGFSKAKIKRVPYACEYCRRNSSMYRPGSNSEVRFNVQCTHY